MDFCIDPDDLERYALGRMLDSEATALEEHLFICDVCRDALGAAEEYIRAMRGVLPTIDGPRV